MNGKDSAITVIPDDATVGTCKTIQILFYLTGSQEKPEDTRTSGESIS